MALIEFAKAELALIRGGEPDEMQDAIEKCVLDLIALFADQGHSGSSASYVTGIVEKLMRFEPLTPLTGADDEWCEVTSDTFQNKRCPHVFKENGEAYDIDGVVFREPSGACFTSRDSRVPVTFPYVPKTEYRDVPVEVA
jgi:hypothetical protein